MPGAIDRVQNWDRVINLIDYGSQLAGGNVEKAVAQAIYEGQTLWGSLSQSGGMRIYLPPAPYPYFLGAPIALADYVEIYVAAGAIVQSDPTLAAALTSFFSGSSVTGARICGGGLLLGSYDYSVSSGICSAIALTSCDETYLDGLHLAGFSRSAIYSVTGRLLKAAHLTIQESGFNGIHLSGELDATIADSHIFSNGQNAVSHGAGILISDSSLRTNVVGVNSSDYAQSFPAVQTYPVQETTSSDYTTIVALQATGNVTSNTPTLVGAHSVNWGSQAVAIDTATPAAEVYGGAGTAGTLGKASDSGHIHPLAFVGFGQVFLSADAPIVAGAATNILTTTLAPGTYLFTATLLVLDTSGVANVVNAYLLDSSGSVYIAGSQVTVPANGYGVVTLTGVKALASNPDTVILIAQGVGAATVKKLDTHSNGIGTGFIAIQVA